MEQKPVIIFGVNTVGKIAKEIFDQHGIITYCFLDDDEAIQNTEIGDVSVLGKTDDEEMIRLLGKECNSFVAIDEIALRKSLTEDLKIKEEVPVNVIHQQAKVADSAHFEYGNFINAGATVNSFSKIGSHNHFHGNVLIDAEATVGNFTTIGAGAIINSGAIIEDEVFIGSGSIIVSGIKIGAGARVGAGSVVVNDVKAGSTVFGNPAKKV